MLLKLAIVLVLTLLHIFLIVHFAETNMGIAQLVAFLLTVVAAIGYWNLLG